MPQLRWIAFSHIEADECGALGEWLEAAPDAAVTDGDILGPAMGPRSSSASPP